jgi:exonuclease III
MVDDNFIIGTNPLILFHRNICGLQKKADELISSVRPNLPYILPLSEHHLKQFELDKISLDGYKLATSYCRKARENGGVCIFVDKNLNFLKVNQSRYCRDQDIEVCALKLEPTVLNICVLAVYRAPCGNFISFLSGLDSVINSLHKAEWKLIICGDINIDYATDSKKKRQLDAMLQSYNLSAIVHFPTRVQNQSSMTVDNTFVYTHKFINYSVCPLYNRLSDHDAQMIFINNINLQIQNSYMQSVRQFSKSSMNDFLIQLIYETWDSTFVDQDVDAIFNAYHNTYPRIFYSNFPKKKVKIKTTSNPWITCGMKISCQHKRELYLTLRNSNNPYLKCYYKTYCKILSNVIKAAKRLHYNTLISNSTTKMKTTGTL